MCCNLMTGVSYAFIMTDALSVDLEGGLASRDRCMSLFFWSVALWPKPFQKACLFL